MTEYQIVYTVDGKGYTPTDPWIFDETNETAKVRGLLDEANKYLKLHSNKYEIWVVGREVSEWQRVDIEFFV